MERKSVLFVLIIRFSATQTVKPRSGVSGSLSKSAKSDGSTRRSLSNINRMLPQPFALGTDRRSPSVGKAIAKTTLQKLPQSHYLNGKVIDKDTQVQLVLFLRVEFFISLSGLNMTDLFFSFYGRLTLRQTPEASNL